MKKRRIIGLFILAFLVLLIIFAFHSPRNSLYSRQEVNQRQVISRMLNIISNQTSAWRMKKRFETPDEAKLEMFQGEGYLIEMSSNGQAFEIWATPTEYKNLGKISYYAASESGDIHGADHQGEKAELKDPVVKETGNEIKTILAESLKTPHL